MEISTKNSLKELFARKQANILSVFYTAGYPHINDTVPIGLALAESGADIIEIGIPFSDPVADGPVIQQSNKVALDNGMNLHLLLSQVSELRTKTDIPVLLMGYLNPVLQYGVEAFCKDAADAGVSGVILPDLPLQEYLSEYKERFDRYDLTNTLLVSPTTAEHRIRQIDEASSGFIYAVSASSTTGAKGNFAEEQLNYFDRLNKMKLKNPFLIGFGISSHDSFKTVCKYAAGAIVGSAFISMLTNSKDLTKDVSHFVNQLTKS